MKFEVWNNLKVRLFKFVNSTISLVRFYGELNKIEKTPAKVNPENHDFGAIFLILCQEISLVL